MANMMQVLQNWLIGRRIVVQNNKERLMQIMASIS